MLRVLLGSAVLILLCACPKPPEPPPDGGVDSGTPPPPPCDGACTADEKCDTATDTCVLSVPSKCSAGTAWAAGTKAFVDSSADWGLVSPVGEGTRISSGDLDGDGWADVVVRRAGNHRDDPSDGGTRAVWVLRNAHGTFEDVTVSSKLLQNRGTSSLGRPAEIVVFGDADNDGDLDAYTGTSLNSEETSELMLNDGAGVFSLGPTQSELRVPDDRIAGASFVDANLDGVLDLWTGGTGRNGVGTQDRLYIGEGNGAFFDDTARSGLTTLDWNLISDLNEARAHSYSWGTTACDLNGDGRPELLSASYGRAPNHLWQAGPVINGVAKYTNRSIASGYAFDPRTDWTDNESARCHCKLHPTDEGCAGVPAPQYFPCNTDADVFRWSHGVDREPFRLGGNTGTTVCADADADGDLDLLNLEIVHFDVGSSSDPSELLYNSGEENVRFERPGNEVTGLTRAHVVPWDDGDITGALFDFDNDGRQDVYIGSTDYPGTRGWLYHQKPDGKFEAVPLADGIDHQSSHGIAVADFDRDGDLDLFVGHSRNRCSLGTHCYPTAAPRLFENAIGQDGNWLQLELEGGPGTNRAAIGARVEVKAGGRTQAFEVGGGYGHYGLQHDLVVHAGLGAACEAEVTVRWPNATGTTQTFKVPANYRLRLVEGGRPLVVRE